MAHPRRKAATTRGGAQPGTVAAGARAPGSPAAGLVVLAVVAFYLLRLIPQVAHARFYMDEPFHAYLAEWIARHRALPRVLPDFYSGLPYFYPPLFHLVAAGWVVLLGSASLPYLNPTLAAALFAALWALPVPGLAQAPRRWALLLCLANAALTAGAVQLYAESLTTLLAVASVLLLLRWRATASLKDAALLGVVVGLALTTKQTAPLLIALLGLLALIHLRRRARHRAVGMAVALAIALALWLPVLVRNEVLFGGPLAPPLSATQRALLDLGHHAFRQTPIEFYAGELATVGPLVLVASLAALAWAARSGRRDLPVGVLGLSGLFLLAAPWIPRLEHRHLNPVCAVMALLASLILDQSARERRRLRLGIEIVLALAGALFVGRMPDYRAGVDLPPWLEEACVAIRARVPEREPVLSLWTYATAYHSGRPATWPTPWAPSAEQVVLFTERDPARFMAALRRLGVDHLLMPLWPPPPEFDGANYPRSLVGCVDQLLASGRLRVLWRSGMLMLVGPPLPAGPRAG